MSSLIARHSYAFAASLRFLRDQSGTAIFTIIVLGLVFALPFALALLVLDAHAGSATLPPAATVAVYLKAAVSEQTARQLAASARQRRDVASATLITAAQALQDLRARSSFGPALDALPDNPLPNTLEVIPAVGVSMSTELETLRAAFAAWPETDAVQVDRAWGLRWDATQALARELLRGAATLLGLAVVAIVANTIRLEIRSRRDEIEIATLVGASDAFVRRPFLYLGVLYAEAAALVALGLVVLAGHVLTPAMASLAAAYGTHFAERWPDPRTVSALFGSAFVVGWLGAALAAARQLARLDAQL